MKKLVAFICVVALMATAIPFALAEEPVEITYFRGDLNRNACAYYSDTLWIQEIEKRLNITLKFVGPASGDDYYTKANAMLSAP